MTGPEAVVVCDDLTKQFGSIRAVDRLSFTVRAGEVIGFLGPNGAGKSTTIRMLMGFLRPTSGTCSVLGGSSATNPALRGRIGFLPGDLRLDPSMTGADLFRWFGKLRGGMNGQRVNELVERFELDPTRRFGELSKGNRQKIGLIQAFQHDPDLLILDEPTSGLDPLLQRLFKDLLHEATARGAAAIFSSHALHEVEQSTHRVVMIRDGRLVRISDIDTLLDSARQRLELRFADPVPNTLFDGTAGVVDVEIDGAIATILVEGPVGDVLRVAVDGGRLLRVRNVGDDLEELFLTLYKKTAGGD